VTQDEVAAGPYRRVLLKLSGEVFGGGAVGLDLDVVSDIARQIHEVVETGVQVAIVVGGGNFFRGAEIAQRGMDRARADYMGMPASTPACRRPSRWARSPSPTSRAGPCATSRRAGW